MAKISRFEELDCWQEARKLVTEVYLICEKGKLRKDFETKNQLKRASLSIMNNIAEGFGRYSKKEFIRFLEYSQSSALEVKSMLYILEDLEYADNKSLKNIKTHLANTLSLTLGLLRYLRNTLDK